MSATIDQRVVEMRFDNQQFERNVQTSIDSINSLQRKLDLNGASRGLEDINAAARNVNMSGLGSAVEGIQMKFSALQIMATTALANITNSAVNAGKRIVSALTIDPVKTGFSEYETKINAIQTIMSNTASKGTTMEDVTKVIGELNTYADKTIYNFAEMTRNIGTFTAAGVGLEESAAAIQGIANLAAASGSTSQQASTAMYQLSQAMSSGTVKLMDWNSVVNAGMGGQKFQDALKATAREHGIAVDDMIKKHGSFRESLTEGWISTEILSETLRKFTVEGAKDYAKSMMESGKWTQAQADALIKEAEAMNDAATKVKTFTQLWDTLKESAQSGWSQTWEIIIGDFEEAKETLTKFSDVIGGMIGAASDARNELLQGWKDAGGRVDLLESLYNIFEGVMSVVKPIKEAFREIFPATTVDQLVKFTKSIRDFTSKLKLSDTASENLKRTFKGLFALVDIVRQVFMGLVKAASSVFGTLVGVGGGFLSVTATIGDWLVAVNEAIKKSTFLGKIFQGLANVIKWVVSSVANVLSFLWDAFDHIGGGLAASLGAAGSAIENSSLLRILNVLWEAVKSIASGILTALNTMAGGIVDVIKSTGLTGVFDILKSIVAGGVGIALIDFIKGLKDSVGGIGDMIDNFSDIFEELAGVLEGYQMRLKADALIKIAGAIAILAVAVWLLTTIDTEKLYDATVAIGMLFAGIVIAFKSLNKATESIFGINKAAKSMVSMALAVLLLAFAVKNIASFDTDELIRGILGIAVLMQILINTVKALASSKDEKKIIQGATKIVIFAAAIKILASACSDLAQLSLGELTKGLIGVGSLITMVSLFVSKTKMEGKMFSTSLGIVLLASAIKILASACADFGQMAGVEIAKGLAAIGALLLELALFTKLTQNAKKVISTGVGLIALAAAMKIFASVMADMAGLSWEGIAKGLVGIGGALVVLAAAIRLLPKNLIGSGVGLIAISTAMLILANALGSMGGMSWTELGKGLLTLGASLGILAIGLKLMTGTLSGSAALVVAVLALSMLVPVMRLLGSMSWGSIIKGLVAIAGTLAIFGIAAALLQPVIPALFSLAGALALIGLSALAFGVGLAAAGVGLTSIVAALGALVGILVVSGAAIFSAVRNLISSVCAGIADGIVEFCRIIIEGIPAIAQALNAIIQAVCMVVIESIPLIVDTLLQLLVALLDSLVKYAPMIVDALFRFVIGILDSLARHIPTFVQKLFDIVASLFRGVVECFKSIDSEAMLDIVLSIGILTAIMAALSAIVPLIPSAMAGAIGLGAFIAELAIILAAVGALAKLPGLNWLINEGGKLLESIGKALGRFIGGFVGGIAQGFSSSLPDVASDLSKFMKNLKPFLDGAKAIDPSMFDGLEAMIDVVKLLGKQTLTCNPSNLTMFSKSLAEFGPGLKEYSDSVSGIDVNSVKDSAEAAKALAEMASIIPNEGGMAAWFTGENSMARFSKDIVKLGEGLKGFSDEVSGISTENIVAAANAAKALVEMTNAIPNEGGMVAWFTGDNSVANFSWDIVKLGKGLKGFSDEIAGVEPDNIIAAANAAKALAEMTNVIPNDGGMVAWFTGDNSVANFGSNIVKLGEGLKGFSDVTTGIVAENIIAAANAAKALAEMANVIPNEGGMVAWFTGDNSISTFGHKLPMLGYGLKGFSDATEGIVAENIIAAANAAKALAEMANVIPNEGGMVAWFTGDNSIANFGYKLPILGYGLKGFSDATVGIVPETVTAAANAAKTLAEMMATIPNEGGMVVWFTGEKSVSNFSKELVQLGHGLKGFSDETVDINPENVAAAAEAAKALAEMANTIPNEGGIVAWFTGEKSVASFGDKLPALGEGLKGFSDAVEGISAENVTAAANAGKALAEMANTIPENHEIVVDFGENIKKFGESVSSYFSSVGEVGEGAINASTNALESIKDITEVDSGKLDSVANGINSVTEALENMADVPKNTAAQFKKDLTELGETGANALLKEFEDVESKMKKAGRNAIDAFIKGVEEKESTATKAFKSLADKCVKALENKESDFKDAGKDAAKGFANGISANTFEATAKAKAMAKAALEAAEEALGIASPSKAFYKDGRFAVLGFANAFKDYGKLAYNAGSNVANSARNGLSDTISRIGDFIAKDIDNQPTIRPVLDLSDVRSGVGAMGDMLNVGSSVGVLANVGAISASMNSRNQNGGNGDVVSAINKLRTDLGKVGNTNYNINGITYDDGSNITEAVKTIVRAARIERRT